MLRHLTRYSPFHFRVDGAIVPTTGAQCPGANGRVGLAGGARHAALESRGSVAYTQVDNLPLLHTGRALAWRASRGRQYRVAAALDHATRVVKRNGVASLSRLVVIITHTAGLIARRPSVVRSSPPNPIGRCPRCRGSGIESPSPWRSRCFRQVARDAQGILRLIEGVHCDRHRPVGARKLDGDAGHEGG